MNMFDEATHTVLMKFLDKKSREAEQEISKRGSLSKEHAMRLEHNLFAGFAVLGSLIAVFRFVHF